MKRKSVFYLLTLLLVWGWMDDLAVSTAGSDPSNGAFTSENDEYLSSAKAPSVHKELKDCSPTREVSSPCSFDPRLAHAALEGFPPPKHLALSATDPLYAFMSLQR